MTGGDYSSVESAAKLFQSIDSLRRLRSQKSQLDSLAASLHDIETRIETATAATDTAQRVKEEEERRLQSLQRELSEAETQITGSDTSRQIVHSLARLSLGRLSVFRSLTDVRSAFCEELSHFFSSHASSSLSDAIDAWHERERQLESRAEEILGKKLETQLELTTLRKQVSEETSLPDLAPLRETVDRLRRELKATETASEETEETQFDVLLRRKQSLVDALREKEEEMARLSKERGSRDGNGTTSKRRRVETAPCELSGTALRVVC